MEYKEVKLGNEILTCYCEYYEYDENTNYGGVYEVKAVFYGVVNIYNLLCELDKIAEIEEKINNI